MKGLPAQPVAQAYSWPRIAFVPLAAVLGLAVLSQGDANQALFLAINQATTALPEGFWANVTVLGDTLVALALILPFTRRRPDVAAAVILAALLATLFVHGLKPLVHLPRPPAVIDHELFRIIGPGYKAGSFPSGHTATAFTLAALLGGYVANWRALLTLILFAALIGLSRIAVGVHWPVDVLGGMLLGWLAGLGGLHIAQRCKRCQSRPVHLAILTLLLACAVWLFTGFDSGYPQAERLQQTIAFAAVVLFFRPMPKKESTHD